MKLSFFLKKTCEKGDITVLCISLQECVDKKDLES